MIQEIKIIVKENDLRWYLDDETGEMVQKKMSTVAPKKGESK